MTDATPEEVLALARRAGVWGTLTINLVGGVPTHSTLRAGVRPSGDPRLAAEVAQLAAFRELAATGATAELVFVRLRGGQLAHLATETHREHQGAARHERDHRHTGQPPPHDDHQRAAGGDLHHAADHGGR